jgi:hypothetical protein
MNKWTSSAGGQYHYLGDWESVKTFRVSIQSFASGPAILKMWFPGCGFSPHEKHCASLDEAKQQGEKWIADNTQN